MSKITVRDENFNDQRIKVKSVGFGHVWEGYGCYISGTTGSKHKPMHLIIDTEVVDWIIREHAKEFPQASIWDEASKIRRKNRLFCRRSR